LNCENRILAVSRTRWRLNIAARIDKVAQDLLENGEDDIGDDEEATDRGYTQDQDQEEPQGVLPFAKSTVFPLVVLTAMEKPRNTSESATISARKGFFDSCLNLPSFSNFHEELIKFVEQVFAANGGQSDLVPNSWPPQSLLVRLECVSLVVSDIC
jgi:hypothetical protein